MIIEGNKLQPSKGYKYITNGETLSTMAFLGIHDSPENWYDTNDETISDSDALNIVTGGASNDTE